jgi:uncharacterized protein YndB with AHSA1/START domain
MTEMATTSERVSDVELVVTRSFNARAALVFKAWTTPELMMRWWTPKSFGITFISCEMDVKTGGTYRFVFGHPAADQPMAFFGRYIEVVPNAKIVWTNEEAEGGAISTATFTEVGGQTRVVVHDLYPTKAALDEALASGTTGAWPEQFESLDGLLPELTA